MKRTKAMEIAEKVQPWVVTVLALMVAALALFRDRIIEALR